MIHTNVFTHRVVSTHFGFTGRKRAILNRAAHAATTTQRSHPAKLTVLAAMTLALFCGVGTAQAQIIFSDGTFNDANWTVAQSNDLVSAHQIGGGGNPGSYRQTRISFNEQFDYAASINSAFIYNPATQGAITGLTFENDLITTNSFGASYYLFFQQAGVSYYDFVAPANTSPSGNVWGHSLRTLNLNDFTRLDGASGSPNFTVTGAALQFGYVDIVVGSGFFQSDTGIDNYALTVAASPAAVPEPGALTLLGAGGLSAFALWKRRRQKASI